MTGDGVDNLQYVLRGMSVQSWHLLGFICFIYKTW